MPKRILPEIPIGTRYGRWTTIGAMHRNNRNLAYCLSRCDCGKEREVSAHDMHRGASTNCGCWKFERPPYFRHGEASHYTKTTEYEIWQGIKKRCLKPRCRAYHNYGGRGIQMCERWQHSFAAFVSDVGRRPSLNHSIDRIDNDGHYEPGNVRWATLSEQRINQRKITLYTFNGRSQSISQWAAEYNIAFGCLYQRLRVAQWSIERALHGQ